MSKTRKAVIYSSASRYIIRFVGLITTMIVARLLSPSEIGTFGVASAIVMIMSEFRLLGAGIYLVREKDISRQNISSALGLTILISWFMGIVILISGPFVADFYNLPPIGIIFAILSVSFFLAPYISIPSAILTRDFEFKLLFYFKITGTFVGMASTILLILNGFSYYSLAWGYTCNVIAELLMVIIFWPKSVPVKPSFIDLKKIAIFGIINSTTNLLRKATMSLPDMVIGKMGTTVQVGIFSRGLGFVDFLSQSLILGIGPVVLPYLSETRRSGGDVVDAYIRASVLLSGIVVPVLAVAGVASLPVIRMFFGQQWDAAAVLASWLSLWAALRSLHYLSNTILTVMEKEKIMLFKELIVFLFYLVVVILAFPGGLIVVAQIFALAGLIEFVITSIVLKRTIGLKNMLFISKLMPTVWVTLVSAAATYWISMYVDFYNENFWPAIMIICLVLPFIWLSSLRLFNHPLYDEMIGLLLMVKNTIKGKFS